MLGARAGEVMWYIYGSVSLIIGMMMLAGMSMMDNKTHDRIDYLILIVLGLICVFAGLDWLNLIPEV